MTLWQLWVLFPTIHRPSVAAKISGDSCAVVFLLYIKTSMFFHKPDLTFMSSVKIWDIPQQTVLSTYRGKSQTCQIFPYSIISSCLFSQLNCKRFTFVPMHSQMGGLRTVISIWSNKLHEWAELNQNVFLQHTGVQLLSFLYLQSVHLSFVIICTRYDWQLWQKIGVLSDTQ